MAQPITYRSFYPRAKIDVWTQKGKHYSLEPMADVVKFTTHRSVDSSPGTWSITLTARSDAEGNSWAKRILPMDYVEIRAGFADPLPIRMRGFVDNAMQSWHIGGTGGPSRRITLNGRDFTKLAIVNQIKYVWQSDPTAALFQNWGLTQTYGIKALISTADSFCRAIVDHIFRPFLMGLREQTDMPVPDIKLDVTVPEQFAIPMLTIEPYSGSFWNLFRYFQSPPMGEAFFYDADDGPHLVFRMAPFKDESGQFVLPASAPALGEIPLDLQTDSGQDIGRSDNEVYNYFFVYSDVMPLGTMTQVAFVKPGVNPRIRQGSIDTFGFRPMSIDTAWVTPFITGDGSSTPPTTAAGELAAYLLATQGHNETLASGSLQVHGSPDLIPGRYVSAPSEGLTWYLQTVDESFSWVGDANPRWTATLGVVRGQ